MDLEELINMENPTHQHQNEQVDVEKGAPKTKKRLTKLQEEKSELSNAKSSAEGLVSIETEGYFRDDEGNFLKNLEQVLNDAMIPYAEDVILDRALTRVEDGLKPVQRRIL